MTSLNYSQKICSQTRNSCAKAFDNRSKSKNLKPKKIEGGGVNLTPPPLLKASRVNSLICYYQIIRRSLQLSQYYLESREGGEHFLLWVCEEICANNVPLSCSQLANVTSGD